MKFTQSRKQQARGIIHKTKKFAIQQVFRYPVPVGFQELLSGTSLIRTRHYGYIFHQFRLQNEHKNILSLY